MITGYLFSHVRVIILSGWFRGIFIKLQTASSLGSSACEQ
jgi:hypothetical protein